MLCDDLFEMFDAVRAYVKEHPGCEVLCSDNPWARRIGFTARGLEESWLTRLRNNPWVKWGLPERLISFLKPKREHFDIWEISLVDVMNSLSKESVTEEVRTIVREAFKTPRGRVAMAQALEKGLSPIAPA
jgi:hypothetical protein